MFSSEEQASLRITFLEGSDILKSFLDPCGDERVAPISSFSIVCPICGSDIYWLLPIITWKLLYESLDEGPSNSKCCQTGHIIRGIAKHVKNSNVGFASAGGKCARDVA